MAVQAGGSVFALALLAIVSLASALLADSWAACIFSRRPNLATGSSVSCGALVSSIVVSRSVSILGKGKSGDGRLVRSVVVPSTELILLFASVTLIVGSASGDGRFS